MIMKASHRAVMVCSESLLFFLLLFLKIIFRIVRRASEQINTRYINYYFARCKYYQINLYFGSKRESCSEILWIVSVINIEQVLFFIFSLPKLSLCFNVFIPQLQHLQKMFYEMQFIRALVCVGSLLVIWCWRMGRKGPDRSRMNKE